MALVCLCSTSCYHHLHSRPSYHTKISDSLVLLNVMSFDCMFEALESYLVSQAEEIRGGEELRETADLEIFLSRPTHTTAECLRPRLFQYSAFFNYRADCEYLRVSPQRQHLHGSVLSSPWKASFDNRLASPDFFLPPPAQRHSLYDRTSIKRNRGIFAATLRELRWRSLMHLCHST